VIVTDLVGHDAQPEDFGLPKAAGMLITNLNKLVVVIGAESDGTFPEIVEKAASEAKGISVLTTLHRYVGGMSDHAAFADAGMPFLFLSCGQGRHYHTAQDTLEWINFDKLAHITRFISEMIKRIDATPIDADHTPMDSINTELQMLRRALGPIAIAGLRAYGIKMPKSRKELDDFISGLIDGNLV
jgi:hypothetical protein